MNNEVKLFDVSLVLGMSYALNCMMIHFIPEGKDKQEMVNKLSEIHIMINEIYYKDKK